MKLYATTTSERASKGQGGKFLDIYITGDKKEEVARIKVNPTQNGYTIDVYPIALPDRLQINVKGHGYNLKRKTTHNENTCTNSLPCWDCEHMGKVDKKKSECSALGCTEMVDRKHARYLNGLPLCDKHAAQADGIESKGNKQKDECIHGHVHRETCTDACKH